LVALIADDSHVVTLDKRRALGAWDLLLSLPVPHRTLFQKWEDAKDFEESIGTANQAWEPEHVILTGRSDATSSE